MIKPFECEPMLLKTDISFNCVDDGIPILDYDDVYTCHQCDETDCYYYNKFNK